MATQKSVTTLHVFKSTFPSMSFLLKNGKPCIFQQGVFRTSVEAEIKELMEEVGEVGRYNSRNPHMYVDEDETTIQSDMVDPMNALRAKFIAEYIAEQTKALDPGNDRGASVQRGVGAANTQDIAAAAAGGSGISPAQLIKISQAAQITK